MGGLVKKQIQLVFHMELAKNFDDEKAFNDLGSELFIGWMHNNRNKES